MTDFLDEKMVQRRKKIFVWKQIARFTFSTHDYDEDIERAFGWAKSGQLGWFMKILVHLVDLLLGF